MRRIGFWILALVLACIAFAYWQLAIAAAAGAIVGIYGYKRLVERAGHELDAEEAARPIYVPEAWGNEKSPRQP